MSCFTVVQIFKKLLQKHFLQLQPRIESLDFLQESVWSLCGDTQGKTNWWVVTDQIGHYRSIKVQSIMR